MKLINSFLIDMKYYIINILNLLAISIIFFYDKIKK